jgi:hypothetical protein
MRPDSGSSPIAFEMGAYMTAPSSRGVSPSDLPSRLLRSLREASQSGSPRTVKPSWIVKAGVSKKPSSSSGSRSSMPPTRPIPGAPIAVVPLSSVGSPAITPSEPPVSRNSSTPQIVVARSAERARILSERLSRLHVRRVMIPSTTSPGPVEPESSHHGSSQPERPVSPAYPARLGTVVLGRGGRHRGSIHRGAYGTRRTFLRRWRAGRLSSLWGALDQFIRPGGLHRRARVTPVAALTSGPGHGSIEPQPHTERED